MQLTHLLSAALLPIAALSSPVAVPGEIVPGTSGSVPGKATWFCTFSYEIMFDHYVLEGHKFGASEAEIKEVIPGKITSWEFYHVGEGWSDFVAKVRLIPVFIETIWGDFLRGLTKADGITQWALPIGMHGKVEKSFNRFIRDNEDFECHLVDVTQDGPVTNVTSLDSEPGQSS